QHVQRVARAYAAERAEIARIEPAQPGRAPALTREVPLVQQLEHAPLLGRELEAGLADVVVEEEEAARTQALVDLVGHVLEVRHVMERARRDDDVVALLGKLDEVEIPDLGRNPAGIARAEDVLAAGERSGADVEEGEVQRGIRAQDRALDAQAARAEYEPT